MQVVAVGEYDGWYVGCGEWRYLGMIFKMMCSWGILMEFCLGGNWV